MNKYIAEFIGTFFLVLTIGLSVLAGEGVIAPLAIGSGLMAMIYAGGHLCGAHFNPAVTIGVFLRGRCPRTDVVPYIVAQLIGAVLAALAVSFLRPEEAAKVTAKSLVVSRALLAEFLFTFALVYVVLNVATSKGTQGNSFYGLAIGFTVLAGAFAIGNISGSVLNPAVAVGACVLGLRAWTSIWIYLLANFAGGVVAANVFKMLNPTDK